MGQVEARHGYKGITGGIPEAMGLFVHRTVYGTTCMMDT